MLRSESDSLLHFLHPSLVVCSKSRLEIKGTCVVALVALGGKRTGTETGGRKVESRKAGTSNGIPQQIVHFRTFSLPILILDYSPRYDLLIRCIINDLDLMYLVPHPSSLQPCAIAIIRHPRVFDSRHASNPRYMLPRPSSFH